MNVHKLFDFRKIIRLIAAVIGIYISIRYAEQCTQGIRNGILFCIEVLVPSLFFFMTLSAYLVRSGMILWIAKPLRGVSRVLFRLSPQGAAALLLSMIGGYPVGARCASMLYEQGQLSESQAQKTACIAVCAGPGFLLNYVGGALLGNPQAGVLLLVSQIIGVLLSGILIGRIVPSNGIKAAVKAQEPPGHLLLSSVTDASRATFHLCGMVVICAAMIEVIAAISPNSTVTDLLSAFTEITTGCRRMCGSYPLPLIAFFIGFGGLSVHLQIYAGLGGLHVHKGLFFLFRIIQGIITAAAAYIYLMIFPLKQSVFNSTNAQLTLSQSATLAGSAALVLSSFCFMGSVRQKRVTKKNA